jgi:hypothetical protein
VACSEGCHQGLHLRRRAPWIMRSTSAAPRSTGKPGAYRAQCSRPGWCRRRAGLGELAAQPVLVHVRAIGDDRLDRDSRIRPRTARSAAIASLMRKPRSCFPFVKGRAWAGQPDMSA